MYLKSWNPVLSKAVCMGPALSIEATLMCPFCGKIITKKTGGHEADTNLKMKMEWEINELKKLIGCPKCGLVSVLPEDDEERLKREITIITKEWIEKTKKEMNLY